MDVLRRRQPLARLEAVRAASHGAPQKCSGPPCECAQGEPHKLLSCRHLLVQLSFTSTSFQGPCKSACEWGLLTSRSGGFAGALKWENIFSLDSF